MTDVQIKNTYPFSTHGDHDHAHDHHDHASGDAHAPIVGGEDDSETMYWDRRTEALVRLLVGKGYFTLDEVRRQIEKVEARTPMNGARVVARAWADPAYKARLLADAKGACAELAVDTSPLANITVLENTESVHYAIVCTLCSCYPRQLLGDPPGWYKSTAYRNRMVVTPRKLLKESFGTAIPESVDLRVVDSTADSRFLVLPRRPQGTEGWTEDQLIRLVTRDSMVGVAEPLTPSALAEG
jgi:nitrile hydratase